MKKFLPALAVSALFAASANAQKISEFRVDQGGSDNDEYFELVGTPGASLDGLHYITIGDGAGASGVVEAVVDLNGLSIPADGYFLAVEPTFTLGGTPDLTTASGGINFENSDNVTHLLVRDFTGVANDDLDTDDDGVLDVTPWTEILDSVACQETDPAVAGDQLYSDFAVGPDGSFAIAHAIRTETGALDAWSIGEFSDLSSDTPGTANPNGFISVGAGGQQVYRIDAGPGNAGGLYLMGWSAAGTSPGIPVDGLFLPLNFDGILSFSIANANGPIFSKTFGFLDANGQAYPSLNLPALDPAFAGLTMHGAGVVYDAFVTSAQAVTGAVAVDLIP